MLAALAILVPLAWLAGQPGRQELFRHERATSTRRWPAVGHDHGSAARSIPTSRWTIRGRPTCVLILSRATEPQHRRSNCARLHHQRHLTWPDDHGTPGPADRELHCATPLSKLASHCTGAASTCPQPWTGSGRDPRRRCRSAASSPIALWPIRLGRTGITHTGSPTSK